MTDEERAKPSRVLTTVLGPLVLLLGAGGLTTAGLGLIKLGESAYGQTLAERNLSPIPLGISLVVLGLLVAGGGVWWGVHKVGDTLYDRLFPAACCFLGAVVALLSAWAFSAWGSLSLLFRGMVLVGCVGAVLVLLPTILRRLAILFLLLLHFGGIWMASTSAPVPSGQPAWIPSAMWTVCYRPYLCFMYLNNAYHFYSPEPGPANLLWFRVEYADGSARWLKLIDREDCACRLQYQRYLAMTEMINQNQPTNMQKIAALADTRRLAGEVDNIPLYPDADLTIQYREPLPLAKVYLQSYARYVARTVKHLEKPETPVKFIKVYRVTHDIIRAGDLAYHASPTDPALYYPYFVGEFTPDGQLRDHRDNPLYERLTQDPYLYWMIPVFRRPKSPNPIGGTVQLELVDCLSRHAGDSPVPEWKNAPPTFHQDPLPDDLNERLGVPDPRKQLRGDAKDKQFGGAGNPRKN